MPGNRANFKLRQQRVQEWLGIVQKQRSEADSRPACKRLTAQASAAFPQRAIFVIGDSLKDSVDVTNSFSILAILSDCRVHASAYKAILGRAAIVYAPAPSSGGKL
jgi:hypothetical protein